MKRLLSLLITLSVIGVGLILSVTLLLVADLELEKRLEQQVDHVHQQIHERFKLFDELIADDERALHKHARRSLSQLEEEVFSTPFDPDQWNAERLDNLSRRLGVDAIYIIDRSTRVVATNFQPDLNFQLGTISDPFNAYLNKLYGTGRIEVDRINVSSKTGILQIYAYYAPLGSDYILEVSYDVRKYLSRTHSPRYVEFMFGDFFTELSHSTPLLEKINIYLVNNYAAYPFLNDTPAIQKALLPEPPLTGFVQIEENERINYYSRADLQRSNLHSADYLTIHSQFNLSPVDQFMQKFLGISSLITLILLGLAFLLVSFLFDRWILQRIFRIISTLERSADGDYSVVIRDEQQDELRLISEHINSMNRRISRRDVELQEAHHHLEQRVTERTADLEQEIDARRQAEAQLLELASTDPLTRVMNRRAFEDQAVLEIERALRYGREFSLILLDIDHFKQINDQYGHHFGDRVLVSIARLLESCLRNIDSLCRHGGEEFVLLLPETNTHAAMELAERLRSEIEAFKINENGETVHLTASFGVTTWRRSEVDIQPAVKRADRAMYQAKEEGRNRVQLAQRITQHSVTY
ncbi:diguanylate cyclase [Neptuniibacter halophilus]|uniref:diguanylate cyclase n=1 Tax=Neptuniibacter halophilus TaxID=651666 RepID=UPI0025741B26|nr:diguanylate cyclase [Neptuniibacter halophilus]